MLFKSIVAAAFATSVAADGASIIASLGKIDQDVAKLNGSVQAFDGNILLGIPVLSDTSNLQNDLKSATTSAQQSANLTTNEAVALINPVQGLARDTNITLTNLINKYPKFKSDNLQGIVASNLKDSKTDSDNFSAAIISKIDPSLRSLAQSYYQPIDDAFNKAIAVYTQGSLF